MTFLYKSVTLFLIFVIKCDDIAGIASTLFAGKREDEDERK